jgi:hypothetical protein
LLESGFVFQFPTWVEAAGKEQAEREEISDRSHRRLSQSQLPLPVAAA